MSSWSGRSLTSFGGGASDPSILAPASDLSTPDNARFVPTALDFAYRAFRAEDALKLSVPSVFQNAQAVDSASFAGQGASFAVYRRRIPRQRVLKSTTVLDGWSVEIEDKRKLPAVVAYKVALIEFSKRGEATESSRHAIDAAIMELYLLAHQPILEHPNLVDFLGLAWGTDPFDSSQKVPALIVEFAEFGSLRQLQQREYLSIETRRKLCLDMCQGLQVLHSCGVVHGDMKAENVLIFPDPEHKYRAKLSDFGYSFVLNGEKDNVLLGGTRPWKAPEAKTAVRVSDAKYTDVYSLALLIWCTFALGRNIFRTLVDSAKQGDDFYTEVERMKETGELIAQTDLSVWYFHVLKLSPYGDPLQLPKHLLSLQHQLQQHSTRPNEAVFAIHAIEESMCAIPSIYFQAIEPLKHQFLQIVQVSGIYDGMQRAVRIGLSNEPSARNLHQIMVCLGGNELPVQEIIAPDQVLDSNLNHHTFSWNHWTKMDPSIQKYLTSIYIQRGEAEAKNNMLNPPEAFLLTALYINGYGVDKDTDRACLWLSRAGRVMHPLATAYGYRIVRALGYKFDTTKGFVEPMKSMALRGSRTALEDLATISYDDYQETKKTIRNVLAGTGASFFFQKQMLHGFGYGAWMKTFENVPVLLENFSRLNRIADYTANTRGDRILHVAASCGQTEAIEALLDRFPDLEVNQLNDQGETPLLCACRAGQTRTVLWLATHGAKASIVAKNGESPLHWLISFDDEEVEEIDSALIQAGADAKVKTKTIIAYQADFPTSLIPDRLPEGYAIGWASHCDRPQIVKFLLSHIVDPRICHESWPRANSALEVAASQLRSVCLELMVNAMERFNAGGELPKHTSFQATGLLQQAVYGSSLFDMILYHGPGYQQAMESTFKCLLPRTNRAAFAQGYGGFNQSLLYFAVSLARDELVEFLLKHGVEAMKSGPDYDEEILKTQDVGAFKKTDINRGCGVDMRTPLLEAVRWNRPWLVKLLLEHGADPTGACRNPFSGQDSTWTALHVLAHAGQNDPRLIQPLLDSGAPIEGFSDHFQTTESPFLIAVQNDSFQLADSLVLQGANINFTTLSSGHLTLTHPTTILGHVIASNARNSIARLRYFLGTALMPDHLHFIVEPQRHWTSLHRAAAAYIDTEFRATDATEASELEWTDIDWGANREIMHELLTRFSRAEQLDAVEESAGLTAMHLAVLAGNEAAVSLLLSRGARVDVPNTAGETAAALALRIQMQGVSMSGEVARPGAMEIAARKECNNHLNPPSGVAT